jgi:predicted phosphoribosyltransferase
VNETASLDLRSRVNPLIPDPFGSLAMCERRLSERERENVPVVSRKGVRARERDRTYEARRRRRRRRSRRRFFVFSGVVVVVVDDVALAWPV